MILDKTKSTRPCSKTRTDANICGATLIAVKLHGPFAECQHIPDAVTVVFRQTILSLAAFPLCPQRSICPTRLPPDSQQRRLSVSSFLVLSPPHWFNSLKHNFKMLSTHLIKNYLVTIKILLYNKRQMQNREPIASLYVCRCIHQMIFASGAAGKWHICCRGNILSFYFVYYIRRNSWNTGTYWTNSAAP